MKHTLTVIGSVRPGTQGFEIQIENSFRRGLTGLAGFSHAIVSWLADRAEAFDTDNDLVLPAPYTSTNDDIGVFASRSPIRPNPIGVSVIAICGMDESRGLVFTPFIDAMPKTPIIDIKPYFPASDLAQTARVPEHFSHWPRSLEESAVFDWVSEFR